MRKVLFFFAMMWCMCMTAFGQDANDELGRQTDLEFNQNKEAVFVNGVFIKSLIGFNIGASGVAKVTKFGVFGLLIEQVRS